MRLAAFGSALSLIALFSACKVPGKEGPVGTFNIGERAQVGPLIYSVIDSQWMVSIGEGASQRVPKDRYLVVNLSVVNSGGKEDQNIPSFALIDDAGQTFNEIDDGSGVPHWLGTIRTVRPADSLEGNILFDAPPKHYKLKVSEEGQNRYAYIDLPLNFTPPPSVEGAAPGSPVPPK